MVKANEKFKVINPLPLNKELDTGNDDEKTEIILNENGTLSLKGVASTTSLDLHGDVINPNCIQKMKEQALSLNIHADHLYNIDDVIGTITNVIPSNDDTLVIQFDIIPSIAPKIKELLDTNVKLGLSIGGTVKEYKNNVDDNGEVIGWEILDIDLYEISLTPLPANWDTFGTVQTVKNLTQAKCITGACEIMRKTKTQENNKKQTMKELKEIKKEIESLKTEIQKESEAENIEETINTMINDMASKIKAEIDEVSAETITQLFEKLSETLKEEILEATKREIAETTKEGLTEEAVVSLFNEMAESLKTEIIDIAKNEITEEIKTEIKEEQNSELEAIRNELNTTKEIVNSFEERLSALENQKDEEGEGEGEEPTEGSQEEDRKESQEDDAGYTEVVQFMEELKQLITENKVNTDEIVEQVQTNVEKNIFGKVEENRNPTAQEPEDVKDLNGVDFIKAKTMNKSDLADKLANTRSANPFVEIMQRLAE